MNSERPKGLPDEFDSQVFVSRRVDHVTFCEFMVAVIFDPSSLTKSDGIALSVYSRFTHQLPDGGVEEALVQQRMRHSGLMRLCGRTVSASDPSTLRLTMDDGQVFSVPVDGGPYESFLIAVGDQEYVI